MQDTALMLLKAVFSIYERTRMKQARRIVICGASIFAMAIETSLRSLPGVATQRLNPDIPEVLDRITATQPDAVLVERDDRLIELLTPLLDCRIPLLILDATTGVLSILDGSRSPSPNIKDLVSAIERLATGNA
jgi:hypothetical protein